ncbi:MAG: 2Fe-2S iron-sulfur cluster-binding protein [Saprospiraceae bacterium]
MAEHIISFTIDGKKCEAPEGQNLVKAAEANGIKIPSLCYYEHIDPPLGTCRVCMVSRDGRPAAACTLKVHEGMNIVVNDPVLEDARKAMVEMMFAEGNHFCPACEKSGDCDLQGLGYQLGVSASRFPHLFLDKRIDYRPKRIIVDHNRCILCRRCVEEVKAEGKYPVFGYQERGVHTCVQVDYEKEALLTEAEALQAMHICPVGAILVRGESQPRPRGERKYDLQDAETVVQPAPVAITSSKGHQKKVIATTSLAGCFGCHMSLLDIDEALLELIELVEISKSPLTDFKKFNKRCDVGIIEGGCCNAENVEVLRTFRDNCDILVAIGECAIWGGLPAMRNFIPLEECLDEAYGHANSDTADGKIIPQDEDLPELLDRVYGCNEVVEIDYYIPGCPPDASHIWKVLKNILFGTNYSVIHSEFKYD